MSWTSYFLNMTQLIQALDFHLPLSYLEDRYDSHNLARFNVSWNSGTFLGWGIPEEFTPGKPHDTLTRMYLRNNCTEIPLLSININCQALYQRGDKQVSLTFHFLRTKRDKIWQQIPTWAEASSWFCGQQNRAVGKSCYRSTRIQERLMAEVRIPRDWFQTELLGGKHNRSRAKDCSKCEENGIPQGSKVKCRS